MNMIEPVAAAGDDSSSLTVPQLDDLLTIPSSAVTHPGAPVVNAIRRPVARELASWRVLKMWPNGEALTDAVTVKLIGVHEGHSIVVTAPEASSALTVNEGALYQFRSFSGESSYEFTAPLLRSCSEPFEYLHIGWPQEPHIEKRERRAGPRVKTELPCMVYPGGKATGPFVKGTISDISSGGAAITLHSELSVFYDEVKLVFQVAVAEQELMIEVRARPVHKPDAAGERVMGVSFAGLGPTEKLALHAFVNAALVREMEIPLYARH